jgi:mRNA interferase MazF
VVVQSDNVALSMLLVAPTSTSARPTSFRPRIDMDGQQTLIMVEQTTVVDSQTELGDFAGRLDAAELDDLDAALRLVFGLF